MAARPNQEATWLELCHALSTCCAASYLRSVAGWQKESAVSAAAARLPTVHASSNASAVPSPVGRSGWAASPRNATRGVALAHGLEKSRVCSLLSMRNGDASMACRSVASSFSGSAAARRGVLKGVMVTNAKCTPAEGNLGRMSVKFDGGCLKPADGEPTDAWLETFSDLPSKIASNADLTRPERFQLWVAKRLFGLSRGAADGVQEYKMPKSPEGYLDILFLDEELRVTRGNRGSIVIAERCAVP